MKTILYTSLLLVVAISLSIASCKNKLETNSDFLIKVDSIHCPDSVTANARFDIEFFGIVGFNGCSSFKTFNQRLDNKNIIIEAWGTFESNGYCPDVLVTLDGQKLSMTIPLAGIYKIKVTEPDNALLYKYIKVK